MIEIRPKNIVNIVLDVIPFCLSYDRLSILWSQLSLFMIRYSYHSSSGGTHTSIPSLSIFIPSVGAILSTFYWRSALALNHKVKYKS